MRYDDSVVIKICSKDLSQEQIRTISVLLANIFTCPDNVITLIGGKSDEPDGSCTLIVFERGAVLSEQLRASERLLGVLPIDNLGNVNS